MGTRNFHAQVQYEDWKGTSTADDDGHTNFRKYLENEDLIKEDEFLVGIELWSGEVHGSSQDDDVYVRALIAA